VATVPWTTDRLLNVLTRETETTKWRDPDRQRRRHRSCAARETGSAHRITDLEAATGGRLAFMIRLGAGLLPDAKTVIQAGDQVYMAAIAGHIAEALAIAALRQARTSRAHEARKPQYRGHGGAAQMKVAIAGAGAVGRSIARELVDNHDVTLLERNPEHIDVDGHSAAHWRLATHAS